MKKTPNISAYRTPCLYVTQCMPRRGIMKNSLMMGITHDGFLYEEDTWGDIYDYEDWEY